MSCPSVKCVCERLVLSQAITFAGGVLTINLPEGSYSNCERYCLLIAQEIPEETTIAATVSITIGADTTAYPLVNCNCSNVNACQIYSRKIYPVKVHTDIQSGVFKLLAKTGCSRCSRAASALPIETTTTEEG